MSKHKYVSDMSVKGINNLISQLVEYRDVELQAKLNKFVEKLAKRGVEFAYDYVSNTFAPCIDFSYKMVDSGKTEVYGKNNSVIHRVWYTRNGAVSGEADISPILMAEYGAGKYADSEHRGTFPGQRNAFRSEWFWYDSQGVKHSSNEDFDMIPTRPMYNTYLDIMDIVNEVAREVFSND